MKTAALVGIFVFCVVSFLGLGLISYNAIQEHHFATARNEALSCLSAMPEAELRAPRNKATGIDVAASGCGDASPSLATREELTDFKARGPTAPNLAAWHAVIEFTKLLGLIALLSGLGTFAMVYFATAGVERAARLSGRSPPPAQPADNSKS